MTEMAWEYSNGDKIRERMELMEMVFACDMCAKPIKLGNLKLIVEASKGLWVCDPCFEYVRFVNRMGSIGDVPFRATIR